MHFKSTLVIGLLAAAPLLFAGNPPWALATHESKPVGVSIVQQAEFVAVPVTITSEQRDSRQNHEDVRQAKTLLLSQVKQDGRIQVIPQPPHYQGKSESRYSSDGPFYASELTLLVPLSKDFPDIAGCALDVQKLISHIKLPTRAHIRTGVAQVAVEDPEQYRPKLLSLIAQNLKATREQFTQKATISLSGLQQPVALCRTGDAQVEIYIPYQITFNFEN